MNIITTIVTVLMAGLFILLLLATIANTTLFEFFIASVVAMVAAGFTYYIVEGGKK